VREIEFRGKTLYDHYDHYASPEPDTKEGTWVYGDLMTEYPYHKGLTIVENGVYHEVDPETVGQYTGLKDKNGVKIFEGDVVKVTYYGEESVHVVKWMGEWDYPAFDLEPFLDCDSNGLSYVMCDCECETEVIGNIHDNPERRTKRARADGLRNKNCLITRR